MSTLREQLQQAQAEVARLRKMARCKREPQKGTLGGVIQELREEKAMGLNQLATKSGVSKGLMSRIEIMADANPTFANLVRIAGALETPLSRIIERWESSIQNPPQA